MRSPLLCELHAHTTISDGSLTVRELVDLYGFAGFDVLAVTEHACRDAGARALTAAAHAGYLACLESEAERARKLYGLLVIPGIELTYDDADPRQRRRMRSPSACAAAISDRRRARPAWSRRRTTTAPR